MKAIIIVILLMGMVKLSLAQPLGTIKGDTAKSENTSFVIKRYYFNKDSVLKSIVLLNVKNKLRDTKSTYMPPDLWAKLADSAAVKRSYEDVFSGERIKELLSDNFIYMMNCLDPKGNILEMTYIIVPVKTSLTATELEKLEKALQKNVRYEMHGTELDKGNYYSFPCIIKYNNLLK